MSLSLNSWLRLFTFKPITFDAFINTFSVRTNNKLVKLTDVIKKKKMTKADLKILYYFFVENKKTYLTNLYNRSLKIPNNIDLTQATLSLNNSHNSQYKNIIRNLYYKDILLYTQTDIKNVRPFLEVIFELYNKNIIDYKLLTPSAIALIKQNKLASVLSGFYFRSSILNPAVIYTLSTKYLKGSKIFTPTLGWSSYMYGFLSDNNVVEYVGTDVIKKVCKTTETLGHKLFPTKKIDIYCSPSENLLFNTKFIKKYKNYFDVIFFSPPYFKLELYRGKMQSTNMYKTYEEWLSQYWEQTINLCQLLLAKNGTLTYIISGYDNIKKLNIDMNNITKKYFKYTKRMALTNNNVDFTQHKDTNETIYFFKHK